MFEKDPSLTPYREVIQDGLRDLDCLMKPVPGQPGKKGVKVMRDRINPERAAKRALSFCGTNPRMI